MPPSPPEQHKERRDGKRAAIVLPIRVWGNGIDGQPFIQDGRTLSISLRGACLEVPSPCAAPGDIVAVEYDEKKAAYQVMWVGQSGTARQDQMGVRCLEPKKFIWERALSAQDKASPEAPPVPVKKEESTETVQPKPSGLGRRKHPRHLCSGRLEIATEGVDVPSTASLSDISEGGCFVEMHSPLPLGTQVQLILRFVDLEIYTKGVVRFSLEGSGSGIQFVEMTDVDQQRLAALVDRLARGEVLQAAPAPEVPQPVTVGANAAVEEEQTPSADLNLQVVQVRRWTNRRRTERVLLSVPIVVQGKAKEGKSFTEETRTVVVNAQGALFKLTSAVSPGQELVITHRATKQEKACRVVHIAVGDDGATEIGVEFIGPSENFWRVSFPGSVPANPTK